MMQRLESPMHSLILGNEAGCGKTFSIFGHLLASAQAAKHAFETKEHKGPFYPSLIMVPPSLISQTADKYIGSFHGVIDVKFWHGSAQFQSRRAKNLNLFIPPTLEALLSWYGQVDSTQPENC